jgi:hypothetical protein
LQFIHKYFTSILLGTSQTNGVLAEVIDRVVSSEESITENNKRSYRLREVHALEGRDTAALNLEDVVGGGEAVVGSSKVESDIGKRSALVTLNSVLAVVALLSANLLVQKLSESAGEDVQGGTGVEDGTSVLLLSNLIAESNGFEVNLPVSLAAEGNVLDVSSELGLIDTTKGSLALAILVIEVESKDGLVQKLLVDHLVEGRDHAVHGNAVIAETEDTVEATKGESQTGLLSGLSEVLVLDLEVADGDNIIGDETRQAARSVVDLELGAIFLISRGSGRVVLRVKVAGDAAALLGRNPEVGATSVENDLEALGRSTDGDLREVWGGQLWLRLVT